MSMASQVQPVGLVVHVQLQIDYGGGDRRRGLIVVRWDGGGGGGAERFNQMFSCSLRFNPV